MVWWKDTFGHFLTYPRASHEARIVENWQKGENLAWMIMTDWIQTDLDEKIIWGSGKSF